MKTHEKKLFLERNYFSTMPVFFGQFMQVPPLHPIHSPLFFFLIQKRITRKSHTATNPSITASPIFIYTNMPPTQYTSHAAIHAITHCSNTIIAAFHPLPISRFTAAIAATQGVYNNVKIRKLTAESPVNI